MSKKKKKKTTDFSKRVPFWKEEENPYTRIQNTSVRKVKKEIRRIQGR